jgi:hypothetical protein
MREQVFVGPRVIAGVLVDIDDWLCRRLAHCVASERAGGGHEKVASGEGHARL